jgi:hypothetical protein
VTDLVRELLELCAAADNSSLDDMIDEFHRNEEFRRRILIIERAYTGPIIEETMH